MEKSVGLLGKDAFLVALAYCDIARPHLVRFAIRRRFRGHNQSRYERLIAVGTDAHVLLLARLICK